MTSKVKICNLALAKLGVSSITSLTDNTIEAKLCNLVYEDTVKEIMSEGAFSSTIRRVALNVTETEPDYEFAYEYQLPTNPKCLRILSINNTPPDNYAFVIEGDKLYSDVSDVHVRYIAYLTESDDYDEMLKKVIISKLAADMAYPLTGSTGLSEALYKKYMNELDDAKSVDGQQGSNQIIYSGDLTEIR